jgi:hypothetical protein
LWPLWRTFAAPRYQQKTLRGPGFGFGFGFAFWGAGLFGFGFGFVSWQLGYLDSDSGSFYKSNQIPPAAKDGLFVQ